MVSLVENQRSCLVSMANLKQEWAKERMDLSVLCMPWSTPGPLNSWMVTSSVLSPPAGMKTSLAVPAWSARISTLL